MELDDIILFVPKKNEYYLIELPFALPTYTRINYHCWAIKMESIFVHKRLWKIIFNGYNALIDVEGEENFRKKNKIIIDVVLIALNKDELSPS